MDDPFSSFIPRIFPHYSWYLVAPFWADVDIRGGVGNISYQVYSIGSPPLDTVNTIISDEENITFIGHWMIVAEWDGVPEWDGLPSQVSAIYYMHNDEIKHQVKLISM